MEYDPRTEKGKPRRAVRRPFGADDDSRYVVLNQGKERGPTVKVDWAIQDDDWLAEPGSAKPKEKSLAEITGLKVRAPGERCAGFR